MKQLQRVITGNGESIFVDLTKVVYISNENVYIITLNGCARYTIPNLSMLKSLPEYFITMSDGIIVNKNYISAINGKAILFEDGSSINVTTKDIDKLLNIFNNNKKSYGGVEIIVDTVDVISFADKTINGNETPDFGWGDDPIKPTPGPGPEPEPKRIWTNEFNDIAGIYPGLMYVHAPQVFPYPNGDVYRWDSDAIYKFNNDTKSFEQIGGYLPGYSNDASTVWTDGETLYISNSSNQARMNDSLTDWTELDPGDCAIGLDWQKEYFFGSARDIWTDGNNIYCNNSTGAFIFNKDIKKWVYLGAIDQPDEDIATGLAWLNEIGLSKEIAKNWQSMTNSEKLNGYNVWSDGTDIYCSKGAEGSIKLNKNTMMWETVQLTGRILGSNIWTDGTDIYCTYGNYQYMWNKSKKDFDEMESNYFSRNGEKFNLSANRLTSFGEKYVNLKATNTFSLVSQKPGNENIYYLDEDVPQIKAQRDWF